MTIEPVLEGDKVVADRVLISGSGDKGTLRMIAEDLRREYTGIHGRLTLGWETTLLAFSTFNIERHEDRGRLSNRAFEGIPTAVIDDKGRPYLQTDLRHEVDIFCLKAWEVYLRGTAATMVAGDAMIPIEYLAKPHILEGGGTIVFGPPARGKSYTALLIAVSVDAGLSQVWECRQGKTMYINLERDGRGVQRRLGAVNSALGLDPDRELMVLNARGRSLSDVKDSVEKAISDHGVEFMLLDSISRAGMGDLTENNPVNRIADVLNNASRSWLGIGHSPRADSSHIYGSMMFDAAADVIIKMSATRMDTTLGVSLEVTKANDIPWPPTMYLKYTFDDYGLHEVSKASQSDFPELIESKEIPLSEQIYQYLLNEAAHDNASHIAQSLNVPHLRANISKILNSDERLVKLPEKGPTGAIEFAVKDSR